MIDPSTPFILYAECSIIYDGRAYSTLELGNYLLLYKSDGSFLVHGADLCKPRNYQQAGSILNVDGNQIISNNKKEKIIIDINNIISYTPLHDWSYSKIEITKTEKELVNKLINNWHDYFDDDFYIIQQEFKTEHGPIDLVGITEDEKYYVIEVKRKKATISNITQLKRYVDILSKKNKVFGYLASPEISDNALKFLKDSGFNWIEVGFD